MKTNLEMHWYFISISALSALLVLIVSFSFEIFQYGDNCGYMSLGIAFAQGRGFIDPALPGSHHFLWWPPGFPLFIALFVRIFGTHWYVLKFVLFLLIYVSFTLYALMLYKEEREIVKPALILSALCFSSGIHLLSSYLYSETFYIATTLFFFFLWYFWKGNLTILRVLLLSVFAVYISSIRLLGVSLPAALTIYLLFFAGEKRNTRWYAVVPGLLLCLFVVVSLFFPPLRVGSLRAAFGLHPLFGSVIAGGAVDNGVTAMDIIIRYGSKAVKFLCGYGLTLIPQAVIRSTYDLYDMNKIKALAMAVVTGIVITGYVRSFKRITLIQLYVLCYMGILFIYGPLYVRLVVPIIPFLFLYLYTGLDTISTIIVKRRLFSVGVVCVLWAGIIGDNALRTLTNPHFTMPPRYGDSRFQNCIEWIVKNVESGITVACQTHSYLYLRRGPYCVPVHGAETVNEFMAYLDMNTIKYIVVSDFYHRPHETYMNKVKEAVEVYPDNFREVFGGRGDTSYILEHIFSPNGRQ